jgi:hypothetical protein
MASIFDRVIGTFIYVFTATVLPLLSDLCLRDKCPVASRVTSTSNDIQLFSKDLTSLIWKMKVLFKLLLTR